MEPQRRREVLIKRQFKRLLNKPSNSCVCCAFVSPKPLAAQILRIAQRLIGPRQRSTRRLHRFSPISTGSNFAPKSTGSDCAIQRLSQVLEAAMKQSTQSTSASSPKVFNASSAAAAAEIHTRQSQSSGVQSPGSEAYSREFVEFKDRLDRRMVQMQVGVCKAPSIRVCVHLMCRRTHQRRGRTIRIKDARGAYMNRNPACRLSSFRAIKLRAKYQPGRSAKSNK